MGLNLNIKRIIFYSIKKKFNKQINYLTKTEIKQISGRAGRYFKLSILFLIVYLIISLLQNN